MIQYKRNDSIIMIQKTILIVLDGVGEYKDYKGNAVKKAHTPFLDSLYKKYPWTLLKTSGNASGLPKGVQGASEPGHLTMGAGRIVWQPFEEINQAIHNGSFYKNKAILECIRFVKKHDSTLHLLGMISDGGVHSHLSHLYALLKLAKKEKINKVIIHGITDGRDVPEQSAEKYILQIYRQTRKIGIGQLATLIGRYYAMDRDKNYKRIRTAYDLLVYGKGTYFASVKEGLQQFYRNSPKDLKTDYYLTPVKLLDKDRFIQKGDGVIFFNFRSDRARELTECFEKRTFKIFPADTNVTVPNISFVCTGPYSDRLPVAFSPLKVVNNVGSWISQKGLKQLRIAETEKYAHVTFFFNSQVHEPNKNEDRILIHSPKVPSYAEKPEMSAYKITSRVLQEINKERYSFILINFANGDLVGHSGDFLAAKKAIETLDRCLAQIVPSAQTNGYNIIITADHGNSEYMINPNNSHNPSHTTFPVRCLIIQTIPKTLRLYKGCSIASIGPTIIKTLGLTAPKEMTAPPLF